MYIIVYLSISTCVLEQKTLKTRKKFSKFRKQSRSGREKVSKIKSTSNTNFEKAPISRKQIIFRIEIIYYRTTCTLIIKQSGFSGQQIFKSIGLANDVSEPMLEPISVFFGCKMSKKLTPILCSDVLGN